MGAVRLTLELEGAVADATLEDPAAWQTALAGFLSNILAIPAVTSVEAVTQRLEKTGT